MKVPHGMLSSETPAIDLVERQRLVDSSVSLNAAGNMDIGMLGTEEFGIMFIGINAKSRADTRVSEGTPSAAREG